MEELITKKTSNPPFPKQVISELPLKLVPKVGNRRWTHRDTSASPSTALRQWTECTPGPRKTMAALFRVPPSEKQRSYRHEKVCGCTVVWISLEKRYCRAGEVTGVLLQYLWGGRGHHQQARNTVHTVSSSVSKQWGYVCRVWYPNQLHIPCRAVIEQYEWNNRQWTLLPFFFWVILHFYHSKTQD